MTARIYTSGRRLALGASTTAIRWIGPTALFALGDGAVVAASGSDGAGLAKIKAHEGAVLAACAHPDGRRLVTAGDDGRICLLDAGGLVEEMFAARGKWIDHIVASPASGVIVAGVGKQAIVFASGRETHRFAYPSTIGGLALDAKGRRLAASHYGGVTLRYALMADDKGVELKWSGSHLAVTFSPDADYVISAMQENALHGWRLPEKTDLRMDGYPAKTKSFSWDKRGRWLATSGAQAAIVWPFVGKLGPQGKPPLQLGERQALVTCVAFHPTEETLALGYSDGAASAVRLADQRAIELDEPGEGAVTALAWSADGRDLAIGDDAGRGAIVSV